MIQLNGYVKLHRKLLQWGWYSDCVVKDVFLHLLIIAAFKDGEFLGQHIKAGQAIIGYGKLATELGFTTQQVRTALKKLESTGEISKKSTNKFTLVTVENWGDYQLDSYDTNIPITNEQQTNNIPITNEQQTNNIPITTSEECKEYKNVKNVKNDKNVKKIYEGVPPELLEPLRDFKDMRKKIKAPLTDRALAMLLKKLNELSDGDMQKSIEILNQSTMNSWKGVYELKEDKPKESGNPFLDMLKKEALKEE
jgi:hypothetical protein